MIAVDLPRLEKLLGGDALQPLRARLVPRCLAGEGGDFQLTALTANQYEALCGLLGKPAKQGAQQLKTSVTELDGALSRAGLAPSLQAALEALDGPLRDLRAERADQQQRWAALVDSIADPRLRDSLVTPLALGSLKRAAGNDPSRAAVLLADARKVIDRLPATGLPLARLAAETLGDAHALDAGRALVGLVLNALAPSIDGADDEKARSRWARLGVSVNELAKPALALNLPARGDTAIGQMLGIAHAAGEPIHLSLSGLLRAPPTWNVAGQPVFVCENPSIVALAAAQLGAGCRPLVCTDGMPAAAQQSLLAQLLQAGAVLAYHGDFDWPGISIGNYVMRQFAARPWRFSAADYMATGGRILAGHPVAADWDSALVPVMIASGYAQDEEAIADVLLADLQS